MATPWLYSLGSHIKHVTRSNMGAKRGNMFLEKKLDYFRECFISLDGGSFFNADLFSMNSGNRWPTVLHVFTVKFETVVPPGTLD